MMEVPLHAGDHPSPLLLYDYTSSCKESSVGLAIGCASIDLMGYFFRANIMPRLTLPFINDASTSQ